MFKIRTLLTLATGAAAAYFLDPQNGARRRAEALRRIQGDVAPQARGVVKKVTEAAPQITTLPNNRARATPEPAPGAPPPITES
jgi:hypothetical protein